MENEKSGEKDIGTMLAIGRERRLDDAVLEIQKYIATRKVFSNHFILDTAPTGDMVRMILGVGRQFSTDDIEFFSALQTKGFHVGIWCAHFSKDKKHHVVVGIW